MNTQELRHAKSIASHVRKHSEALTRDMQSIENLKEKDVREGYSVGKMKTRINIDVTHAIKEIQQVLTDMLDELEHQ